MASLFSGLALMAQEWKKLVCIFNTKPVTLLAVIMNGCTLKKPSWFSCLFEDKFNPEFKWNTSIRSIAKDDGKMINSSCHFTDKCPDEHQFRPAIPYTQEWTLELFVFSKEYYNVGKRNLPTTLVIENVWDGRM